MMDRSGVTWQETLRVAKAMPLWATVFLVGTAVFHAFSLPMVLGVLVGSLAALLNFYFLGRTVEAAVQMDPASARRYMPSRYFLRLGGVALVILLSFWVEILHPLGVIVPLLFPKWIIHTQSLFQKGGDKK